MNKKFTTSQITLLGLMVAILLLMAYTPLGYLNVGPLAITFNIIPVAISAVALGPVGGAITGAVFGLTSFGQCMQRFTSAIPCVEEIIRNQFHSRRFPSQLSP